VQEALDDLIRLLDLEDIEVNLFRGRSPDENRQRVFGGQVAGQALVAAARTVEEPGRLVHYLHAYFLRPGDPQVPIVYDVDRIRDGRSYSTRRVVAIQHGRAIFNLQASFHDHETGLDHQTRPPNEVPDPESLPDFRERMEPYREQLGPAYDMPRPIDIRYTGDDPMSRAGQVSTSQTVWMRANGTLPIDPTLHACIVTYASDMTCSTPPCSRMAGTGSMGCRWRRSIMRCGSTVHFEPTNGCSTNSTPSPPQVLVALLQDRSTPAMATSP